MDEDVKEDILESKFFQILQSAFEPLYALAQKHCWLVCVPTSASLSGMRITPEFVDCHILKPSPLFQGLFEVHNDERKTVEIESKVITTTRGFPKIRKSKIISEELFYNKDFKPFRVVIVSKPLIGKILKKNGGAKQTELPPIRDPEDELVLRKIDQYIDNFKETYIMVKGFENDAREKVEKLVEFATDQLLAANIDFRRMQSNPRQLREISLVIEMYVMMKLYQKLILGLRALYEAEDSSFESITLLLRSKSIASFGVPASIANGDFSSVLRTLDHSLEEAQTPIQILFAFHDTVEEVGRIIDIFNRNQNGAKESEPITTDDLIPLLVWLVSQSKYKYFESALVSAENFIFADFSNTKHGFNLINFKAAISYLKSDGTSLIDANANVSSSPLVTSILSHGSQEFKFHIGGASSNSNRKGDAKDASSTKAPSSPDYFISSFNSSNEAVTGDQGAPLSSRGSSGDLGAKSRQNTEVYKRPPKVIDVDEVTEGRHFPTSNSAHPSATMATQPKSGTNAKPSESKGFFSFLSS